VEQSFWFKGYCDRAKGLVTALVQQGHPLELVCIEGGPISQLEARSMERIQREVANDLKSKGVTDVAIVTRRLGFDEFKSDFASSALGMLADAEDTLDDDLAAAASVRYAMSQTPYTGSSFVMSYSGGGGLGPPHLGLVAFGFDREPDQHLAMLELGDL
jgi:hypothetical protein